MLLLSKSGIVRLSIAVGKGEWEKEKECRRRDKKRISGKIVCNCTYKQWRTLSQNTTDWVIYYSAGTDIGIHI